MKEKKCFKCDAVKPLGEFYRHSRMADGHLNKCKECTKNDMHKQHERNYQDPKRVEKERARGREKYKRLGYKDKYLMPEHRDNHMIKNMNIFCRRRGILNSGEEVHHWNYNEPYSVIILTRSQHKRLHQNLVFDKDTLMFRTKSGLLLKTLKYHVVYAKQVLSDLRYYKDVREIELVR